MKDANHSCDLTLLILQNEKRLKINGVLRGGGVAKVNDAISFH